MTNVGDWGVVNTPGHIYHGMKVVILEVREDRYIAADSPESGRRAFHLGDIVFGLDVIPVYERRLAELEKAVERIGRTAFEHNDITLYEMAVTALDWNGVPIDASD